MKKIILILLGTILILTASGCQKSPPQDLVTQSETIAENVSQNSIEETTAPDQEKKYLLKLDLNSEAIADCLTDEIAERVVTVYLPPSYHDSDKKYPVVYFLHGYGEYADSFVISVQKQLDELFANGANEFILVGVDGRTKLYGSFYTNSPATGKWEDYTVNEVVGFVDQNFRTLTSSESRGIMGFSMGGYSAFDLGLKHPDIFGAVLTMSPGLFDENGLNDALESWSTQTRFKRAYSQTFSPNINKPDADYGNIPEFSGTEEDNKIVADWENGYGNIKGKVDAYLALNKPLKSIKIVYGETDRYAWIINGCKYLANYLEEKSIPYSIESFGISHVIHPEVTETIMVPFFNENLAY